MGYRVQYEIVYTSHIVSLHESKRMTFNKILAGKYLGEHFEKH